MADEVRFPQVSPACRVPISYSKLQQDRRHIMGNGTLPPLAKPFRIDSKEMKPRGFSFSIPLRDLLPSIVAAYDGPEITEDNVECRTVDVLVDGRRERAFTLTTRWSNHNGVPQVLDILRLKSAGSREDAIQRAVMEAKYYAMHGSYVNDYGL